ASEESFLSVCVNKLETVKLAIYVSQRQHQFAPKFQQLSMCRDLLCVQVGMRFNWLRAFEYPSSSFAGLPPPCCCFLLALRLGILDPLPNALQVRLRNTASPLVPLLA